MDKSVTLSLLLMGSLIMLVPFPNMNIFSNAMAIEEDSDKGNNGDNNSPRYEEEDSDKGNNDDNNSPRYEEEDSDKGNNGDNNSPRYEEEDSDKGNNGDNNSPRYEEEDSDKGNNGDNNNLPAYEQDYSDKGSYANNNLLAYEQDYSDKGSYANNNLPAYEQDYSDKGSYANNNLPAYEQDYSDKGNYSNNLPAYEQDYSDNYNVDSSQQLTYDNGYGYDDKKKIPEIFPANKVSELGDRWWQWITGLDKNVVNPFEELGQEGCDVGLQDNGKLLFLVGSPRLNTTGDFPEHECGIPQGTSLLFPIVNVVCDDLEPSPFFGAYETEQRICANNLLDRYDNLTLEIDGYEVQNLEQYRIDSPAGGFEFTAVENNPVFIPAGNGTGVSDGFWILLKPLKPGEHTITFSGALDFRDTELESIIEAGATYFLDVQSPEKSYYPGDYQQHYPTTYEPY